MPRRLTGWAYIYRTDTGELVSEGTVVADPLPDGLELVEQPNRHNVETEQWDPGAKAIGARPPQDIIADLRAKRDAINAQIQALGGQP